MSYLVSAVVRISIHVDSFCWDYDMHCRIVLNLNGHISSIYISKKVKETKIRVSFHHVRFSSCVLRHMPSLMKLMKLINSGNNMWEPLILEFQSSKGYA